ncbi:SET domain-containing protein 4 [Bactrocera neohumeralis]|uniref:SET domain-containing protein 4 n=1 Tax=Bactrocera neohumeralis TaxID=98809 RepID=UPI0021657439|nr:SET domain-containing protein 4 [Bactrocera neohumeralis]
MGRTGRARQRNKRMRVTQNAPEDSLNPLLYELSKLGWHNPSRLTARDFPFTGRGVCSKKQKFCTGDPLINLPLKCLITISTLEEAAHFKSQFDITKFHKDHKISFQSLLALYILHEKHLEEASHISAYINTIPKQFSTPYFCPIAELQRLPVEILEKTVEQHRLIRENYTNLKSVFRRNECSYCGQLYFDEIYTLDAFKWAYFAVNTRSVYVFSRQFKPDKCFFQPLLSDEPNMALAPFLDLFNHSAEVTTSADLLPTGPKKQLEYVLTLESNTSAISPRSQLFISYGALSNFKLLTEYGFFITQNRHDYFSFSLTDIEDFLKHDKTYSNLILHRNKFAFIRHHNLHDEMFVHLDDGSSHNLCVVLHLLVHEQSVYPNVLNQVAFGAAERLANVENEVRSLVSYKINSYRTFLADFEKLTTLSESGKVAKSYMEECIRYLEEYLDSI